MKKQFSLTASGLKDLKEELEKLVTIRPEIANNIKTARDLGDLRENAEYSAAKDAQSRNESRIEEIERIIENSVVISQPKNAGIVELGNTVVMKNGKVTKTFTIVGSVEANPLEGRISDESPIGQALLGKKIDEEVEIKLPTETVTYTIEKIT